MLPIISATSVLIKSKPTLRTAPAIEGLASTSEPLTGEWQRAESQRTERKPRPVFDGELVNDVAAVGNYLSAAGEIQSVAAGQIVSVYA